ncbi:MAG: crotonase/enoyl-CoA hydratase family protein [Pseudomonadota bacterium]
MNSVEIRDEGPTRIVTINRPAARNAVDPETATALYEAFLAFDADDGMSVAILTGANGAFCGGFDLKHAAGGVDDSWFRRHALTGAEDPQDRRPGPMGPTRLHLSKPVIAAVEGPAVAGGMELALWCDMRVMADTAYMGVYCRRWGVPLIDGGTIRLPRIVGQGRALDLIMTGRKVEAKEAQQIGLASRLAPHGGALAKALEVAAELTRFPQECLRADRSVALDQWSLPRHAAFAREWQSAAAFQREGLAGAARFSAGKGRGGSFDEL